MRMFGKHRLVDDALHVDMLDDAMFPELWRGRLYSAIYFAERYSKDGRHVCAYGWPVRKIVDEYIGYRTINGKFAPDEEKNGRALLADLEAMAALVRKALPPTHQKAP